MIHTLTTSAIEKLLTSRYIGYLSYMSGSQPYTIPITFFYDPEESVLLSYSAYGHKIKNMRKHGQVSVLVEDITAINQWKSVQVIGTFEELHGTFAKSRMHDFTMGVKKLFEAKEGYVPESIHDISLGETQFQESIMYEIKIQEFIGKENI